MGRQTPLSSYQYNEESTLLLVPKFLSMVMSILFIFYFIIIFGCVNGNFWLKIMHSELNDQDNVLDLGYCTNLFVECESGQLHARAF